MKNLLIALTVASAATACVDQAPEGLDVNLQTQDRVTGDFLKDDIGLAFDFRRDASAGQHYAILETEDGRHLMTQATAGGYQLLNVLDGRLVVSGPIDGEKTTQGDPAALQELFETSEFKLLGPLRTALTDRGVDSDLQMMAPSDIRAFMWMPSMMH